MTPERRENSREDARRRGRQRRGRERADRGVSRETVFCPGCGSDLPYLSSSGPPTICGGCGYRLRCESCGTDIATHSSRYEFDEAGRTAGDPDPDPDSCPRCEQPADGSEDATLPDEEGFTWE
jgi:hypothetical protein